MRCLTHLGEYNTVHCRRKVVISDSLGGKSRSGIIFFSVTRVDEQMVLRLDDPLCGQI